MPPRLPQVGRNKQAKQNMEEVGQLLPGIPNQITLEEIAPKLPWTAFHILISVSHSWQRAIQTHQVYDARVRSMSTQTFFALSGKALKGDGYTIVNGICLYSMEDSSCYGLPPIPFVPGGVPYNCGCIFWEGKLYIVGGSKYPYPCRPHDEPFNEMYVFDLAGQGQWEECKSMKKGREQFACAIKDGKIYAFGGTAYDVKPARGAQVYDTKSNVWSTIKAMPSLGFRNNVATVGDELFVHGGLIFDKGPLQQRKKRKNSLKLPSTNLLFSAEIYHPVKNSWRTLKNFTQTSDDVVVLVGETFRKLSQDGIETYDKETGTWKDKHPILFGVYLQRYSFTPFAAVSVSGEVLAVVQWTYTSQGYRYEIEMCAIRSKGIGGRNKDIVWQKLQWEDLDSSYGAQHFLCAIQL